MEHHPRFEFRQDARAPLEVPITVMIAGHNEFRARTGNISKGGVFVALLKPPPVGTMVKFALDLDGKVLRDFSEVAWLRDTQKRLDEPAGMGLQFRHFLDDGDIALRRALAKFS